MVGFRLQKALSCFFFSIVFLDQFYSDSEVHIYKLPAASVSLSGRQ